jgi:hypothetical protein
MEHEDNVSVEPDSAHVLPAAVQPAALGVNSEAPSAERPRCSCGQLRSEKDPKRCALGHQWREVGAGLNHVQAVEGPANDTPIEQDKRLVSYSGLHSHQRAVVRFERFIDRLQVRLDSQLAPKARDVTEERLLKAEGLRAAAVAEVERLERSTLAGGQVGGTIKFGGRYRPEDGAAKWLPDCVVKLAAERAQAGDASPLTDDDLRRALQVPRVPVGGRALPVAAPAVGSAVELTGPVEPEPVAADAPMGEPVGPHAVIRGGRRTEDEDAPYQVLDGHKRALLVNGSNYLSWLPVHNARGQAGYEWLAARHDALLERGPAIS